MERNYIKIVSGDFVHLIKKDSVEYVRFKKSSTRLLTFYSQGSEHTILFENNDQIVDFLQEIGVYKY